MRAKLLMMGLKKLICFFFFLYLAVLQPSIFVTLSLFPCVASLTYIHTEARQAVVSDFTVAE